VAPSGVSGVQQLPKAGPSGGFSSQMLAEPTITSWGEVFGRLPYLSPEYAAYLLGPRHKHYIASPAEDVHALSVILYWLLAGRRPSCSVHQLGARRASFSSAGA
jgi:hypothetical protein